MIDKTLAKELSVFLISTNLGIFKIHDPNFFSMFQDFWPQIVIIAVVLIHIQVETEAGMFDKSCYEIESFEDGWARYTRNKVWERKEVENDHQFNGIIPEENSDEDEGTPPADKDNLLTLDEAFFQQMN